MIEARSSTASPAAQGPPRHGFNEPSGHRALAHQLSPRCPGRAPAPAAGELELNPENLALPTETTVPEPSSYFFDASKNITRESLSRNKIPCNVLTRDTCTTESPHEKDPPGQSAC
ncbi:hypothetical protein EMIT0324P_11831 [Pseudomonas chlororaphis]